MQNTLSRTYYQSLLLLVSFFEAIKVYVNVLDHRDCEGLFFSVPFTYLHRLTKSMSLLTQYQKQFLLSKDHLIQGKSLQYTRCCKHSTLWFFLFQETRVSRSYPQFKNVSAGLGFYHLFQCFVCSTLLI